MNAPLERAADADRVLRWFVERARDRVREEAPGAAAVVLTGSACRGEATVLRWGDRDLVLSDLDLAVVLPDAAARDSAAPRLARASRELAAEFAPRGFLATVDIGAYALGDLPRQAARPGSLEWERSGVVLSGDSGVLGLLPAFEARDIPPEEAIRLCENRLLELLAVAPARDETGPAALPALYTGAKSVLDAALALLVARGTCPGRAAERAEAFAALAPEERAGIEVPLVRYWTGFKLAPSRQALAQHFPPATEAQDWARLAWREGAQALLAAYAHLIRRHAPGTGGVLPRAAGRARLRRRLRRAVEAWRERSRRHLAWAGLSNLPAFLRAGAPEHVLGAAAAELAMEALGESAANGSFGRAPVVRGLVPEQAAGWEARRAAAVLAWDRWVMRGARTPEGGL